MIAMKKIVLGTVLALLAAMASAERADANKEAIIKSNSIDADQVSLTRILTGNVTMDKGTLRLTADKAVLKETPEGYLGMVLTSSGGKGATFRQKRDGGGDLWVEGQAQRVEYDERAQVVKLFGNARIRELDGDKVTNALNGDFISYDGRMEKLVSNNQPAGTSKDGDGRSTLVIAPKRQAPAAPAPSAPPAPGKQ
jgi:lipopolysaccharide export system protein LptA